MYILIYDTLNIKNLIMKKINYFNLIIINYDNQEKSTCNIINCIHSTIY